MPGVNLSQSIAEKSAYQAKSGGDKGRLYVFIVFFLTLITWGGVRIGMFIYDKKIETVKQQMEEKKSSFNNLVVNDIADVDARLSLLAQQKKGQLYPKTLLTTLESVVLPANQLTDLRYDFKKNILIVVGIAPGYKEVAQQLMALKSSLHFSNTTITSLTKEKKIDDPSSRVKFEITMAWNEQNNN